MNKNNDTKRRILEKAEILFAEKGFNGVTVRDVTAAAKCNTGAVNYHFQSKKNLYMEVFRSRWIPREFKMYEHLKETLEKIQSPSPAMVIKAVAQAYLEGPLSDEELRRHRQLIIREINNPTEVFEMVADQTLRPLFAYLQERLSPYLPSHLDEESLTLDIMSIFGVLLYFTYSRPMISRVIGRRYDPEFKARLISQVVRFSLEGLEVNGKGEKGCQRRYSQTAPTQDLFLST
ncbi:MAG: TetR/AcrR family transcriptional regulator [Deltaproteobacteria bacterium]|nr:TetR/AcrR family transcriptional regulator [Deltaproteobacteria bacterium]